MSLQGEYILSRYYRRLPEEKKLSRGWVTRFLQRHPGLQFKRGVILDAKRIRACTKVNLRPWFLLLKELLDSQSYHPYLLFNLDETSINFTDKYKGKPIAESNSEQQPQIMQPLRSVTATLVICIAAVGNPLQSSLLWNQKSIPEEFKAFPAYGIPVIANNSGWETDETFEHIMLNIYIPSMIQRREVINMAKQILLILDGHGSRVSLPVILSCLRWNISILVIPAHSSSELQPLDLGVNGSFKSSFAKEASIRINGIPNPSAAAVSQSLTGEEQVPEGLRRYMHVDVSEIQKIEVESESSTFPPLPEDLYLQALGRQSTAPAQRELLAQVIPRTLEKALTIPVIKAAWERSGIYPFHPETVLDRLPEGQPIEAPKAGKPCISGRLLTDRSCIVSILEWQLRRKHQLNQGQKSSPTEEEELLSIMELLEKAYVKIKEAEQHYPPCKLISPSTPSVSPDQVKDLYADIQALRETLRSQAAETKTDGTTSASVHESASVTSPEKDAPARLFRLEDLKAIREMTSDQFAQYAKGFSDRTSPVLQRSCVVRKQRRLDVRRSQIPAADSPESTEVDTSSDFEQIPPPARKTRSIRIQKKNDDYVWDDISDQTE